MPETGLAGPPLDVEAENAKMPMPSDIPVKPPENLELPAPKSPKVYRRSGNLQDLPLRRNIPERKSQ